MTNVRVLGMGFASPVRLPHPPHSWAAPSHPIRRITPGELRPLPPTRNKSASVNISCHLFGLFLAAVLLLFLGKSKTNGIGVLGACKWLVYEAGVSLTGLLAVFINALRYFPSLVTEGGLRLGAE